MGASSTSLPEDRSEWPSFLSGGSLPKVEPVSSSRDKSSVTAVPITTDVSHINSRLDGSNATSVDATAEGSTTSYTYSRPTLSTSVPARVSSMSTRSSAPTGPRMHGFLLPSGLGTSTRAGVNASIDVVASPNSTQCQGQSQTGEQNARSTSVGAVPFRYPSPSLGRKQAWTSAIPSSSVRSGSSTSGSGSESRSRSGSGSPLGSGWKVGSRSRSGSAELVRDADEEVDFTTVDKGDIELGVTVMDTNIDIDGHDGINGACAAFVTPVRSSLPASVGGYLYGPLSSHGYGQGRGVYGSYGWYGSYADSSSSTIDAAASLQPRLFGGYPDAQSFDIAHDTAIGGFATRARANDTVRRGMGFVEMEEEEDEGDGEVMGMGMDLNDEEENKIRNGKRKNERKSSESENKWDGMEMEVDMDMD